MMFIITLLLSINNHRTSTNLSSQLPLVSKWPTSEHLTTQISQPKRPPLNARVTSAWSSSASEAIVKSSLKMREPEKLKWLPSIQVNPLPCNNLLNSTFRKFTKLSQKKIKSQISNLKKLRKWPKIRFQTTCMFQRKRNCKNKLTRHQIQPLQHPKTPQTRHKLNKF